MPSVKEYDLTQRLPNDWQTIWYLVDGHPGLRTEEVLMRIVLNLQASRSV